MNVIINTDDKTTVVGRKQIFHWKDGDLRLGVSDLVSLLSDNDWIMKVDYVLWKKIIDRKVLTWGLTNKVYLLELEWRETVVMKVWSELFREAEFFEFVSNNKITAFPKLLEVCQGWKVLIFEFKKWVNGKDVADSLDGPNWQKLWAEFWKILNQIHSVRTCINGRNRWKSIDEMINYLLVQPKIFEQQEYSYELIKLHDLMQKSHRDLVMLHWDFSPHNCLFDRSDDWQYSISAVLDPSARVSTWINFFDIVYLFNTRWNKNKEQLMRGFLTTYPLDLTNPLFVQFDKVMRMYLAEIYFAMWDNESSEDIIKRLNY